MINADQLLRNLEHFFLIAAILGLAYIGYSLLTQTKTDTVVLTKAFSHASQTFSEKVLIPQLKPYDYYARQINKRDIFTTSAKTAENSSGETMNLPGQLPSDLKVVGIVLGEHPQVVIENNRDHQTYFIEKGQTQAGISLEKVEKNKVYLNYQGQTIGIGLKGSSINVLKATQKN